MIIVGEQQEWPLMRTAQRLLAAIRLLLGVLTLRLGSGTLQVAGG